MRLRSFSPKQMTALCWWCGKSPHREKTAIICDGAVRSGKTVCLSVSFVLWAMHSFSDSNFAVCGKSVKGVRRNILSQICPVLRGLGCTIRERLSENLLEIELSCRKNRFYIFGGYDEASASLIQGVTLSGIFFDEVALMPRSFVEQGLARCSEENARFWFSCNPENPQHWFYREWICKKEERGALYLHFTMNDNPALSRKTKERYRRLFKGDFYKRFVEGKWVAASGLVYPFMQNSFCEAPDSPPCRFAVSCDYGTVNPASFGLWGEVEGVWYRLEEYYFDSRAQGFQRTDEEHYAALRKLCGNRKIDFVTVDPSAASFITLIRRRGEFSVIPAKNNVCEGIVMTFSALKAGRVKICSNCEASVREFGLYRWKDGQSRDEPVKENDHAMDDIRYFVTTLAGRRKSLYSVSVDRKEREEDFCVF